MYNKKAQIGTAITWMIAVFIILFVMMAYIAGSWVSSKNLSNSLALQNTEVRDNFVIARSSVSFFEMPVAGVKLKEVIFNYYDWYVKGDSNLPRNTGEVYSQRIGQRHSLFFTPMEYCYYQNNQQRFVSYGLILFDGVNLPNYDSGQEMYFGFSDFATFSSLNFVMPSSFRFLTGPFINNVQYFWKWPFTFQIKNDVPVLFSFYVKDDVYNPKLNIPGCNDE